MSEPGHTQVYYFEREMNRPSAGTWLKHIGLLLVTLVTATIAGSLYPFGKLPIFPEADPQTWAEIFDFILSLPSRYFALISGTVYLLSTNWELLKYALSFSISVLFILVSHEMGHYIACRIYRVQATLAGGVTIAPELQQRLGPAARRRDGGGSGHHRPSSGTFPG